MIEMIIAQNMKNKSHVIHIIFHLPLFRGRKDMYSLN